MKQMYGNNEISSREFGENLKLTNWILDSGETCHMTPQVSDFIPGSLEVKDKYIKVADGNYVTAKKKVQVKIKMFDDNGDPLLATLHNILLAPYICDRLFQLLRKRSWYILVYFTKAFARCNLGISGKMRLLYHIVHIGNMHFGVNKENFQVKENTT